MNYLNLIKSIIILGCLFITSKVFCQVENNGKWEVTYYGDIYVDTTYLIDYYGNPTNEIYSIDILADLRPDERDTTNEYWEFKNNKLTIRKFINSIPDQIQIYNYKFTEFGLEISDTQNAEVLYIESISKKKISMLKKVNESTYLLELSKISN